jgi:arsenate reductase
MAQAYMKHLFGHLVHAESAGLEAGDLNPLVIKVMMEDGIDISTNSTKTVDEFLSTNPTVDTVITVCDDAAAERCPYIPGAFQRLHWSFPDPSAFQGTEEEILTQTRTIRDQIKARVIEWMDHQYANI